jgi:Cdc6-like AAA superfamily ATPase
MKAKSVFALYGPTNVGKSTTIKKVFALLTDAYPNAPIQTLNPPGIDITIIIEINGIFVGIESQGDPNGRLGESIKRFKKALCSIIVCATRTRGGTVTIVESLQPDFSVVWHRKTSAQHDDAIALTIFNQIQNALKA